MLERLAIANFRSIEAADLQLAPLTVFYGPTAVGKSSALYAPLALRNFILNPNQAADAFFNLGFLNLGGFDACVFNHQAGKSISLEVGLGSGRSEIRYGISLGKANAELRLRANGLSMEARVPIPYPVNQSFPYEHKDPHGTFTVNWNGVACTVAAPSGTPEAQARALEIATRLNTGAEAMKRVDIAPAKRGFFKPSYTPAQLSPTPTTEDEVATLIINDLNLPSRISMDTEEIFGRDFRTQVPPGTATAYFQMTEKRSRTPVHLVNDGFGVNQVVYLLSKIHRAEVETVLVEEPEVHLHPTVIRKLARVCCALVKDERKQLLFTTHSELFLMSLLGCVAEGILGVGDLRCYHATREKKATAFEEQVVTPKGQLEGGLASFVEAELEELRGFLAPNQPR